MTLSEPEYKLKQLKPSSWAVTKNGEIIEIHGGKGSESSAMGSLQELKGEETCP